METAVHKKIYDKGFMYFQCIYHDPCFNKSACVNTEGGFKCLDCPAGFTGPQIQGAGLNEAYNMKQVTTFKVVKLGRAFS